MPRLQQIDVSVNELLKDHVRNKFQAWYSLEAKTESTTAKIPDPLNPLIAISGLPCKLSEYSISFNWWILYGWFFSKYVNSTNFADVDHS